MNGSGELHHHNVYKMPFVNKKVNIIFLAIRYENPKTFLTF